MAVLTGTVSWGIVPLAYDSSNLATMTWDSRGNYLKSANDQLRYQVQWIYSGINEGVEVGNEGNVVNVIFKVETSTDNTNWKTIGNIKKSRDVANKRYDNGSQPIGHRFTVDISQLVSDQLSYSLCPINKGTWQSPFYGGMNGGLTMQDNVIGGSGITGTPISQYNVSENGTFRRVRVSATFEILDAYKEIITATNVLSYAPVIAVINSVNQFERDSVYYYNQFLHDQNSPSADRSKRFLTRCPNWYYDNTENKVDYHKSVRMDEQAEFLQWYVFSTYDGTSPTQYLNYYEIYGIAYKSDGTTTEFVLADFNSLLSTAGASNPLVEFGHNQIRMLIQNVSPDFINNNAYAPQTGAGRPYLTSISPITATVEKYSLNARGRYYDGTLPVPAYVNKTLSATNWYQIDRENENIPYGYVRFHWLNSMGGTDSYTAKRDVVEGLTISRDVIERKSGDRTWYQANSGAVSGSENNVSPNSSYISDTMRGGDIYKGGREVLGVNADRVQSVYTEPLNKSVANWLEEIMLSPNVWIEKDTDATKRGNTSNPYLRPSTKGYIPVIITNSDIETVNQENGLVRFNIEYTLAHKVQTQRN
jgi:hypothetical protein